MRIANVQNGDISLQKPKFVKLTKQTKRFELNKGDILTSLTGNVGRVAEIKATHLPAALNQRVARIKPKEDVDVDRSYLRHFLSSDAFSSFLEQEAHGAAQANVSPNAIQEVPFALPPLEEQKRIVSILDEAFEGLDRARENAEANLKSARELFAQSVESVFDNVDVDSVQTLRLGSIVTRLTNGYVGPTRDIYVDDGIPYLLAKFVKNNRLRFDEKTFITPAFNAKHKKSILKTGDVVLVQSGHIGHCAVIPPEHNGHNCHAMIILSALPEVLSGHYLSAVLNTPKQQDHFQKIRTGSTVPHLTCKLVKEMMLPVPKLDLQTKIVSEIDALRNKVDQIDFLYRTKLQDISDLRQSLLQKAFAGELT